MPLRAAANRFAPWTSAWLTWATCRVLGIQHMTERLQRAERREPWRARPKRVVGVRSLTVSSPARGCACRRPSTRAARPKPPARSSSARRP
eukprot:7058591-Prymnesium_polylepis.1